jgi:DNA-binding GntR family transcriptional regulator
LSVYEVLRGHILDGEFPPGAPLVESALAKKLGVSRTPIREALRRLEQDTLVERVHRGLQVRARSPAEILEIYEVRIVLEGTAARAASERYTDIDRIRLRQLAASLSQRQSGASQELAALNLQFHKAIWQASHNQTLIDVLERLHVHLYRYPDTTYALPGRSQSSLKEHEELMDAIFSRDGDRAAAIASQHMTIARDIRLEMWASDPASLTL